VDGGGGVTLAQALSSKASAAVTSEVDFMRGGRAEPGLLQRSRGRLLGVEL